MESPSVYFTLKESVLGESTVKINPGSNATIEMIFTPRYTGNTEGKGQTIFCSDQSSNGN